MFFAQPKSDTIWTSRVYLEDLEIERLYLLTIHGKKFYVQNWQNIGVFEAFWISYIFPTNFLHISIKFSFLNEGVKGRCHEASIEAVSPQITEYVPRTFFRFILIHLDYVYVWSNLCQLFFPFDFDLLIISCIFTHFMHSATAVFKCEVRPTGSGKNVWKRGLAENRNNWSWELERKE